MNKKLEKIINDANQIGDEELQKLYIKKELAKIEDELTGADFDELEKEVEQGLADLKKDLQDYGQNL